MNLLLELFGLLIDLALQLFKLGVVYFSLDFKLDREVENRLLNFLLGLAYGYFDCFDKARVFILLFMGLLWRPDIEEGAFGA